MKRTLCTVLCVILICASAVAYGKSVVLQYKLTPGQIDNYKLVMTVNMRMPGAPTPQLQSMNMKMSLVMRQKVLGVLPDGTAKVRYDYRDMKVSAPGMSAAQAKANVPKSMSATIRMDKYGRIHGIESIEGVQGVNGMAGFDFN